MSQRARFAQILGEIMMHLGRALASISLVGTAFVAAPCAAQSQAQIDQLQQQIQALQQQLQALQNQFNASQKAQSAAASQSATPPPAAAAPAAAPSPTAAAPAAPTTSPRVTQSAENLFGIESADGRYSIALTGRLHLD